MINDRLFGSDIPSQVKDKLNSRQALAGGVRKRANGTYIDIHGREGLRTGKGIVEESVLDSINTSFDYEADLSSRTPWARMWTAIRLVSKETDEGTGEIEEEGEETELARKIYHVGTHNLSTIGQVFNEAEKSRQLHVDMGIAMDEDVKVYDEEKKALVSTGKTRNEQHSEWHANYEIFPPEHGVTGDNNMFMKPQAGITAVALETEGAVGEIQKTTINFTVPNFHDYDQIFNKYFLKPGAQIFLDYGWDSLEEGLYDPHTLINNSVIPGQLDRDLFGQVGIDDDLTEDGWVTKNAGDCNTVYGLVVDYTAKILSNGSVECSVTIQGANNIILETKADETESDDTAGQLNFNKFEKRLEDMAMFEAVYRLAGDKGREALDIEVANLTTGATSVDDFNAKIQSAAQEAYGGKLWTPTTSAGVAGFYIHVSGEKYINWGLFEDQFLNNYFGYGPNLEQINDGTGYAINSSKSFAFFRESLYIRQNSDDLTDPNLDPPSFLIPEQWDYTYNQAIGKSGLTHTQRVTEINDTPNTVKLTPNKNKVQNTYYKNFTQENLEDTWNRASKFNEKVNNDTNSNQTIASDGSISVRRVDYFSFKNSDVLPITNFDWQRYRIPLREIFINVNLIKTVFQRNIDSLKFKTVMNDLLSTISNTYKGLWDWKITTNSDSKVVIQDLNYSDEVRGTYKTLLAAGKTKEMAREQQTFQTEKFQDIFTFNIMGPNSMVTNYDVTFDFPDGDIGAMYAMQSLTTSDSKFYPPSALIQNHSAFQTLLSKYNSDYDASDHVMFQYLPKISAPDGNEQHANTIALSKSSNQPDSSYQTFLDVMKKEKSWSDFRNNSQYHDAQQIQEKIEATEVIHANNARTKASKATPDPKTTKNQAVGTLNNQNSIQKQINAGQTLANNNGQYWANVITGETFVDEANQKPMPLPMKLTLTVYGIGTIQVGDIFKVDYLPEIYAKRVYFQTMKVRHNLDSAGWYTTIETQFRTKPGEIEDNNSITSTKTSNGYETRKGKTINTGTQVIQKTKEQRTKKGPDWTLSEVISELYQPTQMNFLNPAKVLKPWIDEDNRGNAYLLDNPYDGDMYEYTADGKKTKNKAKPWNQVYYTTSEKVGRPGQQIYTNEDRFGPKSLQNNPLHSESPWFGNSTGQMYHDDGWPDHYSSVKRYRYQPFSHGRRDKNGKSCTVLNNVNLEAFCERITELREVTQANVKNHKPQISSTYTDAAHWNDINLKVFLCRINTLASPGMVVSPGKYTGNRDGSQFTEHRFKGDIFIINPTYMYWIDIPSASDKYFLDGWGAGGSGKSYYTYTVEVNDGSGNPPKEWPKETHTWAGRASNRDSVYSRWWVAGFYAHGEEVWLVVHKKMKKLWGVFPKKGSSATYQDIIKNYDIIEVGYPNKNTKTFQTHVKGHKTTAVKYATKSQQL